MRKPQTAEAQYRRSVEQSCAFYEMNRRLLPLETLRKHLSDELAQAYEGDTLTS